MRACSCKNTGMHFQQDHHSSLYILKTVPWNSIHNPVSQSLHSCCSSLYDEIKLWTIERLDFRDLIKRYDSEGTFFYFDPPYHNIRGLYEYEMEDSDFIDLKEILDSIGGKYLLNINEDEFIKKIFGKPNLKKEYMNYGINGRLREKTKRVELFYYNTQTQLSLS